LNKHNPNKSEKMKRTLKTSLVLLFLWALLGLPGSLPQGQTIAMAQNGSQPSEPLEETTTGKIPHWRQVLDDMRPLNLDGNLRRPFLFFRQAADRPFKPIILLSFLLLFGWVIGLAFPELQKTARQTCGRKFFPCLIHALLFSVLNMTLARLAFLNESLLPLGLFAMGLIQFAYALGLVTGVLILAEKFADLGKLSFKGKTAVLILLASLVIVGISLIGALGPIPRLGNRLVFLVALLGLGSLLESLREKLRQNN
jgi:hypothetical protein